MPLRLTAAAYQIIRYTVATRRRTSRRPPPRPTRARTLRQGLGPGGERPISATEAARNFSNVLNRVELRGEAFVIVRGGRAVARIGPTSPTHLTGADLAALMARLPRPDDEYLDLVERIARAQRPVAPPPWES